MRHPCIVGLGLFAVSFASLASAQTSQNALREVAANVKDTCGPVNRFFVVEGSLSTGLPAVLGRCNPLGREVRYAPTCFPPRAQL